MIFVVFISNWKRHVSPSDIFTTFHYQYVLYAAFVMENTFFHFFVEYIAFTATRRIPISNPIQIPITFISLPNSLFIAHRTMNFFWSHFSYFVHFSIWKSGFPNTKACNLWQCGTYNFALYLFHLHYLRSPHMLRWLTNEFPFQF